MTTYNALDIYGKVVKRVTFTHELIGQYLVQVTSRQFLESAQQSSKNLNKMVEKRENIKDRFKVVLINDKEDGYCVVRKLIPDDPEEFIDKKLLKACEI